MESQLRKGSEPSNQGLLKDSKKIPIEILVV